MCKFIVVLSMCFSCVLVAAEIPNLSPVPEIVVVYTTTLTKTKLGPAKEWVDYFKANTPIVCYHPGDLTLLRDDLARLWAYGKCIPRRWHMCMSVYLTDTKMSL